MGSRGEAGMTTYENPTRTEEIFGISLMSMMIMMMMMMIMMHRHVADTS
jgi:type IV secretory pathway VirB3-like protein